MAAKRVSTVDMVNKLKPSSWSSSEGRRISTNKITHEREVRAAVCMAIGQ